MQRVVRLVEATSYPYTDRNTGNEHRISLPKGRQVLALVPGIARPTMHGGGLHGKVVDLDTGTELHAIFEEIA
jgi:hypothetical protein